MKCKNCTLPTEANWISLRSLFVLDTPCISGQMASACRTWSVAIALSCYVSTIWTEHINSSQQLPFSIPRGDVQRTYLLPQPPWAIEGIHWDDCDTALQLLKNHEFPQRRNPGDRGPFWSRSLPRRILPDTQNAILPYRFASGKHIRDRRHVF